MNHTVIGGRGFIGNALVSQLISEGLECSVFEPLEFIRSKHQSDILYYCIGLTSDFKSHTRRTLDSHVNLLSDILESRRFARLIYLSSSRVYADSVDTSEDANLCLSSYSAENVYLLSKLLGETLVSSVDFAESRIVRLSNVVGFGQPRNTLLGNFLENARTGTLDIHESQSSGRDYVSLEDVVRLLIRIGMSSKSKIYNVSSNRVIRHLEIAEYIRNSSTTNVTFLENSAAKFQNLSVRNEKVVQEFSWAFKDTKARIREIIANELSKK